MDIATTVAVNATNDTRQKADANSNTGGIIAAGASVAKVTTTTSTDAIIGKGANIKASRLIVGANGENDNYAKGNAGSGGLVSVPAVGTYTTDNSASQAIIESSEFEQTIIDLSLGGLTGLVLAADH